MRSLFQQLTQTYLYVMLFTCHGGVHAFVPHPPLIYNICKWFEVQGDM